MRRIHRQTCLWLLLLVLVSQLGLTVHAASHLSVDHADCQLCSNYNSSGHALTASITFIAPDAEAESTLASADALKPFSVTSPYHQRAPPTFS